MKVAVVGSRSLCVTHLELYLPQNVTELVSGGAKGIDACVRQYAVREGITLTEFLPQYPRFGRVAPLKRNAEIINYADTVIALWDGKSSGTRHVIETCKKMGKPITVYHIYMM